MRQSGLLAVVLVRPDAELRSSRSRPECFRDALAFDHGGRIGLAVVAAVLNSEKKLWIPAIAGSLVTLFFVISVIGW